MRGKIRGEAEMEDDGLANLCTPGVGDGGLCEEDVEMEDEPKLRAGKSFGGNIPNPQGKLG